MRNGNLIVKCCSVQQMTTLLQCTKLTDDAVSVEIATSSMRTLGARGVIYNVPLDISTDDLVACLASQGVKFVKRFPFKSSDSSEFKDVNLFFCCLLLLTSLVRWKLDTCFSAWNSMCRDHYGILSVTIMGMSLVIAEVNCAAQFEAANISVASAALLLQNVQTVEAVTPRLIKSAWDAFISLRLNH